MVAAHVRAVLPGEMATALEPIQAQLDTVTHLMTQKLTEVLAPIRHQVEELRRGQGRIPENGACSEESVPQVDHRGNDKENEKGEQRKYRRSFITLAASLTDVPEEVGLSNFMNGLKEEVRYELRTFQPKSLDSAMELSLILEDKLQQKGPRQLSPPPGISPTSFKNIHPKSSFISPFSAGGLTRNTPNTNSNSTKASSYPHTTRSLHSNFPQKSRLPTNSTIHSSATSPLYSTSKPYVMLREFRSTHTGSMMEQWLALKQTRTVTEYRRNYIEMASSLQGVPEEVALSNYLNGLKEGVKAEMRVFKPKILDQAMGLTMIIDSKLQPQAFKSPFHVYNYSPTTIHKKPSITPFSTGGSTRSNSYPNHNPTSPKSFHSNHSQNSRTSTNSNTTTAMSHAKKPPEMRIPVRAYGDYAAVNDIPGEINEELEFEVCPEAVLAVKEEVGKSQQVLIQWKGSPTSEATWEESNLIDQRFPEFHLEDKVRILGRGIVRSMGEAPSQAKFVDRPNINQRRIQQVYSRRARK